MRTLKTWGRIRVGAGDPQYNRPGLIPAWVLRDGWIVGFFGYGRDETDACMGALNQWKGDAAARAGTLRTEQGPPEEIANADHEFETAKQCYESFCSEYKLQAYATWNDD